MNGLVKQYKFGDPVRRILKNRTMFNDHPVYIGQLATVVQPLTAFGDVWVQFTDVAGKAHVQNWQRECVELVEEVPVPECKFVPGNEYHNRAGDAYEFVMHIPAAKHEFQAIFLKKGNKAVTTRCPDGRMVKDKNCQTDIIPNKKTRKISIWRSRHETLFALDEVKHGPIPPAGFHVKIGEIEEEYEDY